MVLYYIKVLKGIIIMSIVLICAAIGGFLYYFEIRRPEVYLKESRQARLGIELTKWAIIIGFFALIILAEEFFVKSLFF